VRLRKVEQLGGRQHAAGASRRASVQVCALGKGRVEQHLHRVIVVHACAQMPGFTRRLEKVELVKAYMGDGKLLTLWPMMEKGVSEES